MSPDLRNMFPEVAEEYDREVARFERGERSEMPVIRLREQVRVEKFDGDPKPGDQPVEVVEYEDERSE